MWKCWNPFAKAVTVVKLRGDSQELEEVKRVLQETKKTLEATQQELAEAPYKAREELVGKYGIRVGYKDLDMLAMQAKIRAIEPSMTIGREGFRWVFYSGRKLTGAEFNTLESVLGFRLDRG